MIYTINLCFIQSIDCGFSAIINEHCNCTIGCHRSYGGVGTAVRDGTIKAHTIGISLLTRWHIEVGLLSFGLTITHIINTILER